MSVEGGRRVVEGGRRVWREVGEHEHTILYSNCKSAEFFFLLNIFIALRY